MKNRTTKRKTELAAIPVQQVLVFSIQLNTVNSCCPEFNLCMLFCALDDLVRIDTDVKVAIFYNDEEYAMYHEINGRCLDDYKNKLNISYNEYDWPLDELESGHIWHNENKHYSYIKSHAWYNVGRLWKEYDIIWYCDNDVRFFQDPKIMMDELHESGHQMFVNKAEHQQQCGIFKGFCNEYDMQPNDTELVEKILAAPYGNDGYRHESRINAGVAMFNTRSVHWPKDFDFWESHIKYHTMLYEYLEKWELYNNDKWNWYNNPFGNHGNVIEEMAYTIMLMFDVHQYLYWRWAESCGFNIFSSRINGWMHNDNNINNCPIHKMTTDGTMRFHHYFSGNWPKFFPPEYWPDAYSAAKEYREKRCPACGQSDDGEWWSTAEVTPKYKIKCT